MGRSRLTTASPCPRSSAKNVKKGGARVTDQAGAYQGVGGADASGGAGDGATSPARMRQVILASSAGTVFEWYDFFIYGALATVMARHFFAGLPESQAFLFALLTFAVGFVVRPLGALVFGKIGDSSGRKGAFLITIVIMGLATVAIGLLPTAEAIGTAAPILLLTCRVLQGFALGGEYGGAAIYVAEHAGPGKRGAATAGIQTSAALGLVGALSVILITRMLTGEEAFLEWGWRVPFLLSAGLLGISVWMRVKLEESPAFQRIQAEGRLSKRAYAESFGQWRTLRIVLLALFGLMMAQGVVWYTGYFYAQFFIERILKVDQRTVNLLMLSVAVISAPLYVFFAWISDKIGRKPVMLFGMALMLVLYIPGFHLLTRAANPALAEASARAPVRVHADPASCALQLDLTGGGGARFESACDIAKSALANAGVSYTAVQAPPGSPAEVRVGAETVRSSSLAGLDGAERKAARAAFQARLGEALARAGYPKAADPARFDFALTLLVMIAFIIAATALYGPQAAAMVELFPTRIRYTAFSLPYNIGTGWFGGMLPATAFAIMTATGDIYAGLWYPIVVTIVAIVVNVLFWPETKDRDINA